MDPIREFFDAMAPSYDDDIVELGWDPVALLKRWPFQVTAGAALLDAGCGTGAVLDNYAGANRKLAGFDVSPKMLAYARRRDGLRNADIRQGDAAGEWPYVDASFDDIICLGVLEFVEDVTGPLLEIERLLKVGGRAIVSFDDIVDAAGNELPPTELRYGSLPLWRRSLEEVLSSVPSGLDLVRTERVTAYEVVELGFTTAYHVVELERNARA
jgi:SAM-dependent methyltransferase